MAIKAIVGVNWGDEGKGRMVDVLSEWAKYVIRFQGGSNAGHTIVNEFGEFKLHLMPSGVFRPGTVNLLGPGTVVNLEAACSEMDDLRSRGIDINADNYKIADRATICFPYHKLQDGYEEERLSDKPFGSTKQGIAPAYGDKYMKYGIQVGALLDAEYLREQLERCLALKNLIFERVYGKPPVSVDEMFDWAMQYGGRLRPHICDAIDLMYDAVQADENVLFEGQLGSLRDITYGIYPYTTSSSPTAAYAPAGAGCTYARDVEIIGVMKAFATCVGEGPFTTEMDEASGSSLREVAKEYGAATGRPRRVGHFDVVASRYGVRVQGCTELTITKLDCLSGLDPLKLCTAYRIGDRTTDRFPMGGDLFRAEPIYDEMPGWTEDITGVREYGELPAAARAYVERIEELVGCRIRYVSVGPERESLIVR
jgi:adenylosuccinate synthase